MDSIIKHSEIKKISIMSFLQKLGYNPIKKKPTFSMFQCPFRDDNHPTLRVNTKYNKWLDYGSGMKGDIISLGKLIYKCEDTEEVVRKIWKVYFSGTIQEFKTSDVSGNDCILTNIEIENLIDNQLLGYIDSRGIDLSVAEEYCKEIRYNHRGQQKNAIAFGNISGGFEIFNQELRGTIGNHDISVFKAAIRSPYCMIFEKMIDFLSYLSFNLSVDFGVFSETIDYIILNSTENIKNVFPYLRNYEMLACCLTNDSEGEKLINIISKYHDSVHDISKVYEGFRCFNDFLRNRPLIKESHINYD